MVSQRSDFTELMKKDMYKWFFESYDQLPTVHDKIFEIQDSTAGYEKEVNTSALGDLVESRESDDIIFEKVAEGRIKITKIRTFQKGIEMSEDSVDDAPKEKVANLLKAYAATWGEAVNRSKEKFAADFFNKGGYTSGDALFNQAVTGVIGYGGGNLVYDGKPFFNLSNNTRSSLGGGTYYNGFALALSDANLQTVHTAMTSTNNRDEKDERIALRPDILLIPSTLVFTAKKILNSTNVLGSANNDINVVQNIVDPLEWQYLTDSDAWFLGAAKKGLRWYRRYSKPVIDFYQNPINRNYYATIKDRWGASVTDWRYWAGSQFSTS